MAEDVREPAAEPPAVIGTRSVDIVVYLMLIGLALVLGYDNWKTGASWESDGPQAGYFPFYLCILLGGASLYGLADKLFVAKGPSEPFVNREQFRRVMQVLIPTFLF